MTEKTHFGFKTVEAGEKASLVRGVFDRVASRYDVMNDLMSGGLHRLWKNDMVAWLRPTDGMRVLDVAGGTGDIAFRIKKKAACHVTVCDINNAMLEEGRNRAIDRNIPPPPSPRSRGEVGRGGIDWVCGDAEALPLPDSGFDAYTIAFGIRNVTHIDAALREAYRVLKPGGRFLCLEFSKVKQEWLRRFYDLYSFHAIPRIGQWVTGSGDPYQYLVESIRNFPDQERFAQMIREAGFDNVQYRSLTQGVVAIHSGRRL